MAGLVEKLVDLVGQYVALNTPYVALQTHDLHH